MRGLAFMLMIIAFSAMQAGVQCGASVKLLRIQLIKLSQVKSLIIHPETCGFCQCVPDRKQFGYCDNADGEFVLKVPVNELNRKVGFSNLGYKNLVVAVSEMKAKDNVIRLELAATPLEEVVIRSDDPVDC